MANRSRRHSRSRVGPLTCTRVSVICLLAILTACEGKRRHFIDTETLQGSQDGSGDSGPRALESDKAASEPTRESSPNINRGYGGARVGAAGAEEFDAGTRNPNDDSGSVGCVSGSSEPCGPTVAVGICKFGTRTCTESEWSECKGAVFPQQRDCGSSEDHDCDGQPDTLGDDVCRCVPGSVEPCDEHAGRDGRGPCRAGQRSCVTGEGNLTSDWSACEGAVGPAADDSCTAAGDDSNCNGAPNGGCSCIEGETVSCGPDTNDGICERGISTCVNGSFSQCQGAVFPARRDCRSAQDNDCDGRPDNTVDSTCTCIIGDVEACSTHAGRDGNGPCQAGQRQCDAGANNVTSRFGACFGSVGPAANDSCTTLGDDANCDGTPNGACQCIAGQGNRPCSQDANASLCNAQGQCVPCQQNAHCSLLSGGRRFCDRGRCILPPFCGDGIVNGNEVCDGGASGSTALGACSPECTGFYQKKFFSLTSNSYGTNLGGIRGADAICGDEFGAGWKALLVGGARRATVTPFSGDGQQDWVIDKYTHYFNDQDQLVWRTDSVSLLAVGRGGRQNLFAQLFDGATFGGPYAWSGYEGDWTTQADGNDAGGTCLGWTSTDLLRGASFIAGPSFTRPDLTYLSTSCGSTIQRLLCVEQ